MSEWIQIGVAMNVNKRPKMYWGGRYIITLSMVGWRKLDAMPYTVLKHRKSARRTPLMPSIETDEMRVIFRFRADGGDLNFVK